jgi:acyl-CoA synthetase (AMP-forming)/AMP-acid ligase II
VVSDPHPALGTRRHEHQRPRGRGPAGHAPRHPQRGGGRHARRPLGERVCCYVVPADGGSAPTLDSIKDYLRERGIAVQKTPERLELVDALPTTATGKVQKHLLRQDIARKVDAAARASA